MALFAGQVQTAPYQSPDYGPSVAAAREYAMTGAQGMAGMVSQVGDYFKQQGEAKKSAQLGIKIAEAAKLMDPNQAPYYDNLIFSMKDENTPVQVRGALGASVQDLLKQNVSSRAVAVQEAQMGMRPAYFGGGRQAAARPTYSTSAISQAASTGRGVDMSQGDAALAGQPNQGMMPPGAEESLVLPGEAGADLLNIGQLTAEAERLDIPAEIINPSITGIESALLNPTPESENTIQAHKSNLASIVQKAAELRKPAQDPSGKPQIMISEDESGVVSRFTRTKGGQLLDESGVLRDSSGKPIPKPAYKQIDLNAIDRALNPEGNVLPPLPESEQLPPEASRTRPPSFQELTAVPPIPEGGVQRIGEQEPQPEQKSAGLGLMAKESQIKQTQASGEELKRLTELSPRKAKLYESALNQAYQDVATAPSENVIKEMELQLLMKPESKGAQVMSEEEYTRRNISTINKAKIRARDRAGMYKILERFDVIQQLANHPEASKVFGKAIPEEKLRELARTEGGVYALYENLKGQDLVQAMADIKAQSGTAANMSERETFALQSAVSAFNLKQDWNSAQKSLMQMANTAIRAGKNLGADDSIFDTSPMTPATYDANGKKLTEASKRQISRANEILNAPQALPLFRDEIEYFNRVNSLKSRLQGGQGTGTTQPAPQAQPQSQPFAVTPVELESIFFPTRQPQ
jgi:hypothetical protein